MRFIISVLSISVLLFSCQTKNKKQIDSSLKTGEASKYKLELLWETDTVLQTPESVIYDDSTAKLYVSNINTEPWGKSGDGYISTMDIKGNIIELNWVDGLNSPKGMGIVGNSLYVADLDCIVEIDIAKGEIIEKHIIENEDGLNDITVGDAGEVYVSSSANSIIYKLQNATIEQLVQGDDERYNGLLYRKDGLMLLTSKGNQFKKYSFETGEFTILANDIGVGDGIVAIGEEEFVISDWKGEIFFVDKDYTLTSLLDTKELEENTADIWFLEESNTLLVPTFNKNTVAAFKLIIE